MTDPRSLGPWLRRFLTEHLVSERNLARNTQCSYRDTLALLLRFVSRKLHKRKRVANPGIDGGDGGGAATDEKRETVGAGAGKGQILEELSEIAVRFASVRLGGLDQA